MKLPSIAASAALALTPIADRSSQEQLMVAKRLLNGEHALLAAVVWD